MKKLVAIIVSVFLLPALSFALSLDEAKVQGSIGETPSGYLAIVSPPGTTAVQDLVKEINQKRKAQYRKIAEKNGTALEAVEKLAGKTAIEKTDSGNYILLPNGTWTRK